MTYDEFRARLASTAVYEVEGDPDFDVMMPQALEYAELRCLRDLDPIKYRTRIQVPLAVVDQGILTVPAEVVIVRTVWYHADMVGWSRIERRGVEFLRLYSPVPGTLGVPKYWGSMDGVVVQVVPIPPVDTVLDLDVTERPASSRLGVANPTTWLSEWVPDVLFAAAMVFAAGYQRSFGEAQVVGKDGLSWESMYQTALASAAIEMRRRKGDGPWDNSRVPPVSSVAPPG